MNTIKSTSGIQIFILIISVFLLVGVTRAQNLINDFDSTGTGTTYHTLTEGNWIDSGFDIAPQAGTVALLSANGNNSGTFYGIGITQEYDLIISDQIYDVSFAIGRYADLSGLELADFSSLYIGGSNGVMVWNDTPDLTNNGEWYIWSGTYTPSEADLGQAFTFEAIFDLGPQKTIALDGPITAIPKLPLNNLFEVASGSNEYFELGSGNWTSGYGIAPNAGNEALLSANGNENFTFEDIGIIKDLGGVITDQSYQVSFYIGKYNNIDGPQFTDFSTLYIGSGNGSMVWESTPTPENDGEWVQWQGAFTPAPEDIGQTFKFAAIFDLAAQHSIAIDGPIAVNLQPVAISQWNSGPEELLPVSNYPNPFNPETRIKFTLPYKSEVSLIIYDQKGREISQLVSDRLNPGVHEILWNGDHQPSGIYWYRLATSQGSQLGSMILLK